MKVNIYNIKNNGKRKYAHFDKRLGLKESYKYISDPENIEKHNFYPFIYYEKKIYKFNKENGLKEKNYIILFWKKQFRLARELRHLMSAMKKTAA